jgi:hypothetical protein
MAGQERLGNEGLTSFRGWDLLPRCWGYQGWMHIDKDSEDRRTMAPGWSYSPHRQCIGETEFANREVG